MYLKWFWAYESQALKWIAAAGKALRMGMILFRKQTLSFLLPLFFLFLSAYFYRHSIFAARSQSEG